MSQFSRFLPQLGRVLLGGAVVAAAMIGTVNAAEKKGDPMSYGEARDFLAKHTKLVELTNGNGAGVAVTPEWQGRVMTSTCGGNEAQASASSTAITSRPARPIRTSTTTAPKNRMWLCPEGGQFSLWFKPGAEQVMENWFTPPAFNEGGWKVLSVPRRAIQHEEPPT